jgi:hypothetical protein
MKFFFHKEKYIDARSFFSIKLIFVLESDFEMLWGW